MHAQRGSPVMSPKIRHRCLHRGGLRELALSPRSLNHYDLYPQTPPGRPCPFNGFSRQLHLGVSAENVGMTVHYKSEAHCGGGRGPNCPPPHGTRFLEAGHAEAASCLGGAESRWSRTGTVWTSDGAEEGHGGRSAWPRQRVRENMCPSEEPDIHL